MAFKDFPTFSSGGRFIQRKEAVYAILVEGITENNLVKLLQFFSIFNSEEGMKVAFRLPCKQCGFR